VGKMLALPFHIGYINEPFNKKSGVKGIHRGFLYIRKGMKSEPQYHKLVQDILHGRAVYKRQPLTGSNLLRMAGQFVFKGRSNLGYLFSKYNPVIKRYLIKDPLACMSSEYLHQVFDVEVVVLLRHPAAFVCSLKRLNWRVNLVELYRQEELMQDHLDEILGDLQIDNLSALETMALSWKCIYQVLFRYLQRNPRMIGIKHEDLSLNPSQHFRKLYESLSIPYTPRIDRTVRSFSKSSNPVDPSHDAAHALRRNSRENIKRWKRLLSNQEVENIKRITQDLANRYYSDEEW
jgi:hypothetical protein